MSKVINTDLSVRCECDAKGRQHALSMGITHIFFLR